MTSDEEAAMLPSAGDRYVDAAQISAELGINIQTAQQYFRTGGLRGRKVGHRWVTTRAAFDAWLTSGPIPGDATHPPAGAADDVAVGYELPPLETKS